MYVYFSPKRVGGGLATPRVAKQTMFLFIIIFFCFNFNFLFSVFAYFYFEVILEFFFFFSKFKVFSSFYVKIETCVSHVHFSI
jgi:hypothetical protein